MQCNMHARICDVMVFVLSFGLHDVQKLTQSVN